MRASIREQAITKIRGRPELVLRSCAVPREGGEVHPKEHRVECHGKRFPDKEFRAIRDVMAEGNLGPLVELALETIRHMNTD